jgi:long-chain acyl-CoA synthetase
MNNPSRILKLPTENNLAIPILEQTRKYGDKVAMRCKRDGVWREVTWSALGEQLNAAARALLELGLNEGEMISIFSPNMPECTIADVASLSIRGVPVYIYPTNPAKTAEYIVNDSESRMIFVGTQDQYDKVISFISASSCLKKIIAFRKEINLNAHPMAMHFDAFLDMGRGSSKGPEISSRLERASQDDLLTLIYTSGTTGEPKGVMLTHSNMFHSAASHDIRLIDPNDRDVSLCFLPLSHVFERAWTYYVLHRGMTNNYLEDPKTIIEAIKEVKPTIMCAVPRFYEKIYATVFHRLESASPLKKRLFEWAIDVGARRNNCIKDEQPVPFVLEAMYRIADALVLKKIRDIVGGRIKFFPCAGAPLSQKIEEFFYATGIFICYGYGLSETTATVTCHEPRHFKFGLVGKPMPGVQVKISGNGEILVKGGTVMKGYYKKSVETEEVFENGWFKTGDAGEFDDNGELRITDRIKDLMKTSSGKYVAPQYLESVIGGDHFIEQIAVIGDNRKFVSALIVPAFEILQEYAQTHQILWTCREDLIQHPSVIELFRRRIESRSNDLAGYEKIIRFTLMPNEFSIAGGEITPTMKIKRKNVINKYQGIIEDMYPA